MTTTYTTHFRFPIPAFNSGPWQEQFETALRNIDTAIFNGLVAASTGPWTNSTAFIVGDVAIDAADSSLWVCGVSHTSAATPTTFAQDRAAHPTYWEALTLAITPRGDWANATAYAYLDLVQVPSLGIVALCTTSHTSSAGPATINTDVANWQYLINLTNANLFSVISTLAALAASAVAPTNDKVMVLDASASVAKSMAYVDFMSAVQTLASLAAPAIDDQFGVLDTSDSSTMKRMALSDMFKAIGLLASETAPTLSDGVALWDASAGTTDFITLANLFKALGLSALKAAPVVGDLLVFFDSVGLVMKAISLGAYITAFQATASDIAIKASQVTFVTPASLANKPCFRANKNAVDQSAIASATATKITFTTEEFDVGSYYDAANSKWTPPAGKYIIMARLYWSAALVDGNVTEVRIYKNGGATDQRYMLAGGTTDGQNIIALVDANGTDFFEVYAFAAGAGTKTVAGSGVYTSFQGWQL